MNEEIQNIIERFEAAFPNPICEVSAKSWDYGNMVKVAVTLGVIIKTGNMASGDVEKATNEAIEKIKIALN